MVSAAAMAAACAADQSPEGALATAADGRSGWGRRAAFVTGSAGGPAFGSTDMGEEGGRTSGSGPCIKCMSGSAAALLNNDVLPDIIEANVGFLDFRSVTHSARMRVGRPAVELLTLIGERRVGS